MSVICERGEKEAKYIVKDEYMKDWHNNLCDKCFKEEIEEYDKEGTKYVVSLIK